jgi:hypothetical protein
MFILNLKYDLDTTAYHDEQTHFINTLVNIRKRSFSFFS